MNSIETLVSYKLADIRHAIRDQVRTIKQEEDLLEKKRAYLRDLVKQEAEYVTYLEENGVEFMS